MRKILFIIITACFFLLPQHKIFAQTNVPVQDYYKGTVVRVISSGENNVMGYKVLFQILEVQITTGPDSGKTINISYGKDSQITKDQEVSQGQEVILTKITNQSGKTSYSIYDTYRLNPLLVLLVLFFVLIVIVAGLKGIGSVLGMSFSLFIIMVFIIPNILSGKDPLAVTVVGSVAIIFVSTYLAHGVSKKTTVALISTLIALILAAAFSIFAINFAKLTGLGNEDFANLMLGTTSFINIKGLFLSGIIIGTLGALNDITTTQSATIFELKKTNDKLKFSQLLKKGFGVGKEHIASLVNTLILAYAGSSIAIFIFLALNPAHLPYWVILNNEIISGEIIRIIAGSSGLILAVPIVTLIASLAVSKKIS